MYVKDVLNCNMKLKYYPIYNQAFVIDTFIDI